MNRRAFLLAAASLPMVSSVVAPPQGAPEAVDASAAWWDGRSLCFVGQDGVRTIVPYARVISAAPRSDGTISLAFGTEARRVPSV